MQSVWTWVEAYIEGVGWMMFEPTIGFTNQNEIDFDIGDTFTILVNPKMPKTFRFENDKNPYSVKSCIIMAASGLVALIIGVII